MLKLRELCELITKGTTPSTIGAETTSQGVIYIRSDAITQGRHLDKKCFTYIDENTHEQLKRSQIHENDILFSMAGALLGKTAVVTPLDVPANTNQAVAIIRVRHEIVDYNYVYYYLSQKSIQQYVRNLNAQSAQPNVNLQQIGDIEINIPEDKETQILVSSVLSSYDNKIENNIRHIDILEKYIQTIYQNWFCNESAQTSWDRVLLDDVIKRVTKKNNAIQTEITITISAKDGITSNYYSKRIASNDLSKYTVVEKGDFIYNRSSSDGYPVGVICRLEEFERVALSPIYFCFRAKNIVSAKFLTYYFNSKDFTTSLYQIVGIGSRGHGMLNFSMNDFMGINLALPPMPLQQKFETVIAPIEKKIAKLREENNVLAEIRDILLPKLMSGELAVEVGEG